MHFIQRKLWGGNGTRVGGQTPNVVIQSDECLIRGQRMLNRERLLQGDENIDQGDRAVERRNKNTLLHIIRDNVSAGSMVWSDEWAPYRSIRGENDRILHESVNHSTEFTSIDGVHAQNIERVWSSLKQYILRSMKNTSKELLENQSSIVAQLNVSGEKNEYGFLGSIPVRLALEYMTVHELLRAIAGKTILPCTCFPNDLTCGTLQF
ncbi:hypothetical protein RF11_09388 [Thelohanellus kitauei]|uniref:ISXO2-like transposase domain-containing protein n=1 Tax=Thelohanellus kitauei TaxID=669202 RepID=A0A0C2MK95_THEKT|nr:hypothetical protein RF11_09388 [Thelohanellus kitauei]